MSQCPPSSSPHIITLLFQPINFQCHIFILPENIRKTQEKECGNRTFHQLQVTELRRGVEDATIRDGGFLCQGGGVNFSGGLGPWRTLCMCFFCILVVILGKRDILAFSDQVHFFDLSSDPVNILKGPQFFSHH